MKRTRLLPIIAVALATAMVVAPLVIRGCYRYYALNKVFKLPGAQARLALKPTRRTLVDQAPVQLVNLGYATFDTGSTNHLSIESGSSGASILMTNREVFMVLMAPFARDKSPNPASPEISARQTPNRPSAEARMREWEADPIASQMDWEETQPLPFSRVVAMNRDEFLWYFLMLSLKASYGAGSDSVEFFQSPYTKGIVRIGNHTTGGEDANHSRTVTVLIASLDGTKSVGLQLRLANPSATNFSAYLDPVLRSFRFTAQRVDDREAVKALIRNAGIPQRKEPETND